VAPPVSTMCRSAGNDITTDAAGSWEAGVGIQARVDIGDLSVVDTSIARATDGIRFVGDGFSWTPVCALNRMADTVANPLSGVNRLPEKALITAGAGSRGGPEFGAGRLLAGVGCPDGQVTANVGDLFQRVDAKNAGSVLFVKESGNATTTGWVAK
jgi:hypothetical protein